MEEKKYDEKGMEKREVEKTTIEEKGKPENKKPVEEIKKEKWALAEKFKDAVVKKYQKILKSVVVFGSVVRGDCHEGSDIDIIVIYDDVAARFTPDMKAEFDFQLQTIAKSIHPLMSIQPAWSLTEFWEMARNGHPLLLTVVRDGWALYDTGFFIPFRKLLEMGKIYPSMEAINLFSTEAPAKIIRVESAKMTMIAEDLYYAMLNSAQALLMFMKKELPPPKHTPKILREELVKTGKLPEKYYYYLKRVIEFRKGVEHKEISYVSGKKLDMYIAMAKKFVGRMAKMLKELKNKDKSEKIENNYETMVKICLSMLKKKGVLPKTPQELPAAITEHLFNTGIMREDYQTTFKKVIAMRKMLADGMVDQISEADVDNVAFFVERFKEDMKGMYDEEDLVKYEKADDFFPKQEGSE